MGWNILTSFIAPVIGVGKDLYDRHLSDKAIKDLVLRQIVGNDGLIGAGKLGVPIRIAGLTLTVTALPPLGELSNRYHLEVVKDDESGDSPDRVRTYLMARDAGGKISFNRT